MTKETKKCPECQSSLRTVQLSDLIGNKKEQQISDNLPLRNTIFEHVSLRVCIQCGRMVIYAGSRIRRIAARNSEEDEGAIIPSPS
jgi:uncharacterized protein with PIN domain